MSLPEFRTQNPFRRGIAKRFPLRTAYAAVCLWELLLFSPTSRLPANPTGGQVVSGSASIHGSGSTLTVNQATPTAIIDWQNFSIGAGQITKFVQPSQTSATLNRVVSANPSSLYGTLTSNGQLYLINPNGILVGPSGIVNTAGFTASTRDITNQDFLAGDLHFSGNSPAGVQNLGSINASGGNVYLIGETVDNQGRIKAAQGTAGLVAGNDVLLMQAGSQSLFVQPTANSASGLATLTAIRNSGRIAAASAELKAANGNMYALAINNSGTIVATTVKHQGGKILLTADSGSIVNSGTLNASATTTRGKGGTVILKSSGEGTVVQSGSILARGGIGGAGGQVEVYGHTVELPGTVDTTARDGSTGEFTIDPSTFTVAASGGDETGAAVASMLGSSNVTLEADNAVTIDDGISWTTTNALNLKTDAPGSTIQINSPISGLRGNLTIDAAAATDQVTTGAMGSVNVSSFILQNGTWTQNSATLPAFSASGDFELKNGSTFLRVTGGNGTTNPYQIADIYGLQGLASPSGSLLAAHAELVANLDATTTSTWNGGAGFVPIGNTSAYDTGTFDGQGHAINGLFINRPGTTDVGLFGVASGTLQNVTLNAVNVTGGTYVGGVVGALGNDAGGTAAGTGSIIDASSTGSVSGDNYVGGLAGLNHGLSIDRSLSGGSVSGGGFVGGLVGSSLSALSDTYSTAAVSGSGGPVGGLVGENYYGGTVTRSYSSGQVSGSSETGGLIGRNLATVTESFWDTSTSGITSTSAGVGSGSGSGITGDPTSTLLMESTYTSAGWNVGNALGTNTWVTFDGETRPLLGMEYSQTITNAHQLQLAGLNAPTLGAAYTLANDIDASGTSNASDVWGTSANSGTGFVPIGTNGDSFVGTLDGLGHTVDNLYIHAPSNSYVGLIGLEGVAATVENLQMTNVQISGSNIPVDGFVGGLIGYNEGTVVNTSVSGSVSSTGDTYVGGLVGYSAQGIISSSFNAATVYGPGGNAYVGGLVGQNQGQIENTYNTGSVGGYLVGGLVGVNYGTISNSYSSGAVSGTAEAGGFIASNGGTLSNSFWDTQTSGFPTGGVASGSSTGLTGASTAQLMSQSYILAHSPTSPTWDFTTIWTTHGDTTLPQLLMVESQTTNGLDTLSGTAFTDSGITDAPTVVVDLLFDGSLLESTTTNGTGGFSFNVSAADLMGGVLLVDATDKGNTFYQANAPAASITGIDLYGNTLSVTASAASNAALAQAAGTFSTGVDYTVNGSALSTITGVNMRILAAYTLDGDITASGNLTASSGAVLMGSQAVTLTGSSVDLGGSLTNSSAVTIASTTGDVDLTGVALSAPNATLTSAGNINLSGTTTNAGLGLTLDATGTILDSSPVTVSSFVLQGGTWIQIVGQNGLTSLPTFSDTGNFALQNGSTFERFAGGNGSAGNPYQIADVYGLQGLGSPSEALFMANAELVNDIDASSTANWTGAGTSGFVPIGYYDDYNSIDANTYSGTFNGQNHTINGLTEVTAGDRGTGLFGDTAANGAVENVGLTNINFTGDTYVGGLVGVDNGPLTNDYTTGSVTGTTYVGGLVGNMVATLNEVQSSASVSGSSEVGGIAGLVQGGTISNAYSTGAISGDGSSSSIGGLVGDNDGTIQNTYSSGTVSGGSGVGGLVGYNANSITNSFWDTTTSGITSPTGGVGGGTNTGVTAATTAQLKDQSFILANSPASPTWNFAPGTGIWGSDGVKGMMVNGTLTAVAVNSGLPYLQAQDPTSVELVAHDQTIPSGGSISSNASEYTVLPSSSSLASTVSGPISLAASTGNTAAGIYPGAIHFVFTPDVGVTVEQSLGTETITSGGGGGGGTGGGGTGGGSGSGGEGGGSSNPGTSPTMALSNPVVLNLPATANQNVPDPNPTTTAPLDNAAVLIPVSFTSSGNVNQSGLDGDELASSSDTGGTLDSGDAAQVSSTGGLNNVSNPAAAGLVADALTPATRLNLADALETLGSTESSALVASGPQGDDQETILTDGDVVQLGDNKITSIPLSQAPKQLQDAMQKNVQDVLPSAGKTGH